MAEATLKADVESNKGTYVLQEILRKEKGRVSSASRHTGIKLIFTNIHISLLRNQNQDLLLLVFLRWKTFKSALFSSSFCVNELSFLFILCTAQLVQLAKLFLLYVKSAKFAWKKNPGSRLAK